jgi:lysophospholipase L1-like esterase
MKIVKHLVLSAAFLLSLNFCMAQKKVVILGSSSAAGAGANPTDSSWARRLQFEFRKNTSDNVDTPIVNLAYPGFVTYQVMPTDYPLPPNRTGWPPDPIRNVTAALAEQPSVIIINLPSNDVNLPDYNKKETMDNFRYLFQQISGAGVRCFITTTQPRNDMSTAQRQLLRELYDSVINNFGVYAIDVWSDLVSTDGQNLLRAEVNADNIHPNNLGHRLLFARVLAEDLFTVALPLPLHLKDFRAELKGNGVAIRWETAFEEAGTFFEVQRSGDGRNFETVHTEAVTLNTTSATYSWTDRRPLSGKSFYRLSITELGRTRYSAVQLIEYSQKFSIRNLRVRPTEITAELNVAEESRGTLQVISAAGVVVKTQSCILKAPVTTLNIGIVELAQGSYFLRIADGKGQETVKGFGKQ